MFKKYELIRFHAPRKVTSGKTFMLPDKMFLEVRKKYVPEVYIQYSPVLRASLKLEA